jgi:hypothetical protein
VAWPGRRAFEPGEGRPFQARGSFLQFCLQRRLLTGHACPLQSCGGNATAPPPPYLWHHFAICAASALPCGTAWGRLPHQQGDSVPSTAAGPSCDTCQPRLPIHELPPPHSPPPHGPPATPTARLPRDCGRPPTAVVKYEALTTTSKACGACHCLPGGRKTGTTVVTTAAGTPFRERAITVRARSPTAANERRRGGNS